MEKVAEQHILQKCSKCSRFGVMSTFLTLLKVATIAITHLAMEPRSEKYQEDIFRLYKSASTRLWQPSKSTKKNPWQNT